MCFFNRGTTERTNSLKILCLTFVYVLLNICKFVSWLILWFYGNLWFDDLCEEWIGDRLKFALALIADVILCGWLGSKYQLTITVHLYLCLFTGQIVSIHPGQRGKVLDREIWRCWDVKGYHCAQRIGKLVIIIYCLQLFCLFAFQIIIILSKFLLSIYTGMDHNIRCLVEETGSYSLLGPLPNFFTYTQCHYKINTRIL